MRSGIHTLLLILLSAILSIASPHILDMPACLPACLHLQDTVIMNMVPALDGEKSVKWKAIGDALQRPPQAIRQRYEYLTVRKEQKMIEREQQRNYLQENQHILS